MEIGEGTGDRYRGVYVMCCALVSSCVLCAYPLSRFTLRGRRSGILVVVLQPVKLVHRYH